MSTPEHREVAQLRTHDLGYLIEVLSERKVEMPPVVSTSDWLTPWGVLFRYDDDPTISLERDKALEAATAAIVLAEQLVTR